jgi:hypothetical protein
MEYEQLNILLNELRKTHEDIISKDKSFDINKYQTKTEGILFNFFEGCRSIYKEEEAENCIITFRDLIKKIERIWGNQFKHDRTEQSYITVYKPLGINICELNELDQQILRIKEKLVNDSINYLKGFIDDIKTGKFEIIHPLKPPKQTKKPSDNQSFKTRLEPEHLQEVFEILVESGLIKKETDLKDFIIIFSGEKVKNKIIWSGHYNELRYFIREIIDNDIVFFNKVFWPIVIRCFKHKSGKEFTIEKLQHTKNPDLKSKEKLNQIITLMKKYS